jgi:16S rRNA A1518/A1519 N6-dimethyltransferase RsmA/KsgA/DIM1 with predicted DNA glycosylase/AP lyase activity
MKRLATHSQNFLRSPQLVAKLIARSTLKASDTVYDIGAGSGIISAELSKKVKNVIAIEFDARVAETFQRNMAEKMPHKNNVELRIGDFMTMKLPTEPYKIFANIPFHLSSPIVQRFINTPHSPKAIYLIVQKQFGRKLVASDANHFTSQLGMIIGAEYSVKIIKSLQRTDFWPHPAVDTVLIELLKRTTPLIEPARLAAYQRFTNECFADPKKLARMPLEVIGATAGLSPSRLSLSQWVILFHSQTIY